MGILFEKNAREDIYDTKIGKNIEEGVIGSKKCLNEFFRNKLS